MNSYSRVYASIDLDAVESNMRAMKDSLPPSASMIGVVKTDGYGHGAVPVARAIDPYVKGYAVATIDEAADVSAEAARGAGEPAPDAGRSPRTGGRETPSSRKPATMVGALGESQGALWDE